MAGLVGNCRHLLKPLASSTTRSVDNVFIRSAISGLQARSRSTDMDRQKPNDLMTEESRELLQKTHDLLVEEALVKGTERETKVWNFKTPQQILDTMNIEIKDQGASNEELLEIYKQTISDSVQTAHPRYFNQLYSGRNIAGLASTWVIEALNSNVHTYETGPVFTVTEQYVMEQVCQKLGYKQGEGIFNPGGSMCNFIAIHLARYRFNNAIKTKGIRNCPQMALITTSDAHYSVAKAAHLMGFGTDNVVNVDTDDLNRMCPKDLDKKIQQLLDKGVVPLIVIATSGTTVTGAFDPLDRLADVCQEHGVWLHVDGCWGGGVIFSDNHKHLLKGIERTDSISISFHKLMGANVQCAALMVNHKDLLRACNGTDASYLFQTDKAYYKPSYDIGTSTVQCGRKADGYKFWALWKARGNIAMQKHVDDAFDKARYFTERIRALDGFKPVFPEYVNISFWFIPPSIRWQKESPEYWEKVDKVAPLIKSRMITDGTVAIGYQPLPSKGYVNFFRIIIDNPLTTYEDLDYLLSEIQRLGADL